MSPQHDDHENAFHSTPELAPSGDPVHCYRVGQDSATKSSRVYFFIIAGIIAAAIAIFLILHPQAGD